MVKKDQLDSCLPAIENYFNNSAVKSFTKNKFSDIFIRNKYDWGLPSNRSAKMCIRDRS